MLFWRTTQGSVQVHSVEQTGGPPESRIDLVAIWRVLWKYRLVIGLFTLIFGAIAAYFAFTAVPGYRAEVSIAEVSPSNANGMSSLTNQIGGLASLVGVNIGSGTGGPSREYQGLLRSRHLAEEFVVSHKLIPVLFPDAPKPPTLWFTVRKFREGILTIRDDKKTGLTNLEIDWTDPAVAAQWANDYVTLANNELRDRAIKESKASIDYLNTQIAQTNVVELQKVMYNLIESNTKTLMLANVRAEYAFAVIDPAVKAEERSTPHRRLMVMAGLLVGGLLGVTFAFAHNRWRLYKSESR
jgi:uncharacterized protein involved in exopolysaccharide biosynthesis